MRKPRAIVYEDEALILMMLKRFLGRRGYEVFGFSEPVVCPVYGKNGSGCTGKYACSDIMISDFAMPLTNGIELLERQLQRGCKLNPLNKAVISGRMDKENEERIKTMGSVFFPKPFTLPEIVSWLDECEKRFDLSQPLIDVEKRRHPRDPYQTQVDYRCEGDPDSCIAQCVNISEEGICLLLMKEYREGQEMTITSELPTASKKASIRWIRKVGDSSYSAGLKFL